MNQSNKEYIELLIKSGVHTFLKETPNNLLDSEEKTKENNKNTLSKSLDQITNIKDLVSLISLQNSSLKKNANKLVVFDGDINSKICLLERLLAKKRMSKENHLLEELENYLTKCCQLLTYLAQKSI